MDVHRNTQISKQKHAPLLVLSILYIAPVFTMVLGLTSEVQGWPRLGWASYYLRVGGGSHRDGNGSLCTLDTLTSVCPSFLYIPRNNLSTSLNSNLNLLWTPNLLPHEVQCPGSTHMTHMVLGLESRTLAPTCQQIRSQTSCPG